MNNNKKRFKKRPVVIALILLIILFFPIRTGVLKDGGTTIWNAVLYKAVLWHKILPDDMRDILPQLEQYENVSFFWRWDPNARTPIDLLWEKEKQTVCEQYRMQIQ
jgi:hypothetical protein